MGKIWHTASDLITAATEASYMGIPLSGVVGGAIGSGVGMLTSDDLFDMKVYGTGYGLLGMAAPNLIQGANRFLSSKYLKGVEASAAMEGEKFAGASNLKASANLTLGGIAEMASFEGTKSLFNRDPVTNEETENAKWTGLGASFVGGGIGHIVSDKWITKGLMK